MADESGTRSNVMLLGSVAGVVALAGMQYYTLGNLRAVETRVAEVQAEQAKAKDAIQAEIEKVQSATKGGVAEREQALAAVRTELDQAREQAREQARGIAGKVREEALKGVKELNTRVSANEQQLRDTHAQVSNELSGIKEAASSTNTTIASVSTEVREVREEVASTRGQLAATIADLKRVTGDLGVMSGLIATNGKEIDALRQVGDRNYVEFTVWKSRNPVRVGEVWVALKDTNTSKSRYTIELRADDRKIEKKDRGANEPVQFYVGKNKQPHELVVNQVQKNAIIGYLATPKVPAGR